jgi:hypothetical protein
MAVINILKDGTIVDDMSKVKVPREIVLNIMRMKKEGEKKNGKF